MRSLELIVTVFLTFLGSISYAAEDQSTAKNTYDKYKVIFERNMFSKDRLPSQDRSQGVRQTRMTTVLSIYVLRGIAAEAGRAHKFAFVEEQISGVSKMARIGTKILGGQIKDIQMNYVLFEENGKKRKIKVGAEFGKTSSTVMRDVTESAKEEQTANDTSPKEEKGDESLQADESDMLKKLMERRKREMGT